MTTKLSGKIEEVITRRLQSKTHHFPPPSSTDPVRKVLFEQSPSSDQVLSADVYDADGGGAPVKRGGLLQRHHGKGESVNEAKESVASRPAREEGGGAERIYCFSGAQGDRGTEAGRDRSLPRIPWSPHSSSASLGLADYCQVDSCCVRNPLQPGPLKAGFLSCRIQVAYLVIKTGPKRVCTAGSHDVG